MISGKKFLIIIGAFELTFISITHLCQVIWERTLPLISITIKSVTNEKGLINNIFIMTGLKKISAKIIYITK